MTCAKLLLLCLASLCLGAPAAAAASAFDALLRERQEQLYYTVETLPATVRALIDDAPAVQEAIDSYAAAKDEYVKFNLVLILDKQVRSGRVKDADKALALTFFASCLEHGNPWIKTEAVYALGNAQAQGALPAIRRCFDDDSATVVFHAALSYIEVTKQRPDLTREQQGRFDAAARAAEAGNDGLNRLADQELARYVSAAPY
jgi:hypothetical protein